MMLGLPGDAARPRRCQRKGASFQVQPISRNPGREVGLAGLRRVPRASAPARSRADRCRPGDPASAAALERARGGRDRSRRRTNSSDLSRTSLGRRQFALDGDAPVFLPEAIRLRHSVCAFPARESV